MNMRVIVIDPWLRGAGLAALMDLALLWVCGRILRLSIRKRRIMSAALFGGVYQFVLGIRWELGLVRSWEWAVFLLIGALLVLWSFPPENPARGIRSVFLFYLLTFLTVGVSMGALSLARFAGGSEMPPWQFFLLNLGSLAIVAELGWGMVHEAVWTRKNLATLVITFGEESLQVDALIDTGNFLRDPLTGIPVVIVSYPDVKSIFSKPLGRFAQRLLEGEVPLAKDQEVWRTRVRMIPAVSVGNRRELLAGLAADQLEMVSPYQLKIRPAILGLVPHRLSGDYQAVFPAVLLAETMAQPHKEVK